MESISETYAKPLVSALMGRSGSDVQQCGSAVWRRKTRLDDTLPVFDGRGERITDYAETILVGGQERSLVFSDEPSPDQVYSNHRRVPLDAFAERATSLSTLLPHPHVPFKL